MSEYSQNAINTWFDKNKKYDLKQYDVNTIKKMIEDEEETVIFLDEDKKLVNDRLKEVEHQDRLELKAPEKEQVQPEPEVKPEPLPVQEEAKVEPLKPIKAQPKTPKALTSYDRNLIDDYVSKIDLDSDFGDQEYSNELQKRKAFIESKSNRLNLDVEEQNAITTKLKKLSELNDQYIEQGEKLKQELEAASKEKRGRLVKEARKLQQSQEKLIRSHESIVDLEFNPIVKKIEKDYKDIQESIKYYEQFQEYWLHKRDVKRQEIEEGGNLQKTQVRFFGSKKEPVTQYLPKPQFGQYLMLPEVMVEDLSEEDFDRTTEAAADIYKIFKPKSVSVHTKGPSPLTNKKISDLITQKAKAIVDLKLATDDPGQAILANEEKSRSIQIEKERLRIAKQLFGMTVAGKVLTKNNISEVFDEIFKDEDKIEKLAQYIYSQKGFIDGHLGDYKLMEMAISATGKYTLPGDLKGKPITMSMLQKERLAQQLHELSFFDTEKYRAAYGAYKELPEGMAEKLLARVPENNRKKTTNLMNQFSEIRSKRDSIIRNIELKVRQAEPAEKENITQDLATINKFSRQLNLINAELSRVFHEEIPMDSSLTDEILRKPTELPQKLRSLIQDAMNPDSDLGFFKDRKVTQTIDVEGRPQTVTTDEFKNDNFFVQQYEKGLIDNELESFRNENNLEVIEPKGFFERLSPYIYGKSTKLIAAEKRDKATQDRITDLMNRLRTQYEMGFVAETTPAFLKLFQEEGFADSDEIIDFAAQMEMNEAIKNLQPYAEEEIIKDEDLEVGDETDADKVMEESKNLGDRSFLEQYVGDLKKDKIREENNIMMQRNGYSLEKSKQVENLQIELSKQLILQKYEKDQTRFMFPTIDPKETVKNTIMYEMMLGPLAAGPMRLSQLKEYAIGADMLTQRLPLVSKIEDIGTDVAAGVAAYLAKKGLISDPRTIGGAGLLTDKIGLDDAIDVDEFQINVDDAKMKELVDFNFRLLAMSGDVMTDSERMLDQYQQRLIEADPKDNYFLPNEFGSQMTLQEYPAFLQNHFKSQIRFSDDINRKPKWDDIKDKTLPQVGKQYYVPEDYFKEEMRQYAQVRGESFKYGFNKIAHTFEDAMFANSAFDPRTGKLTKEITNMGKLITAAGFIPRMSIEAVRSNYYVYGQALPHYSKMLLGLTTDEDEENFHRNYKRIPSWWSRVLAHTALGDYGLMGELDYIAENRGLDPDNPLRTAARSLGIAGDFLIPWEGAMIRPLRSIGGRVSKTASSFRQLGSGVIPMGQIDNAKLFAWRTSLKYTDMGLRGTAATIENAGLATLVGLGATLVGADPLNFVIGTFGITSIPRLYGYTKEGNLLRKIGKPLKTKFLGKPKEVKQPNTIRATEVDFANVMTANDAIKASFHAGLYDDQPLGIAASLLSANPGMMFVPGTALMDNLIGTIFEKLSPVINKRFEGKPDGAIIKLSNLTADIGALLQGKPTRAFLKGIHADNMKILTRGHVSYKDIVEYEVYKSVERFMEKDDPTIKYGFLNPQGLIDALKSKNLEPFEFEKRKKAILNTTSKLKAYFRAIGINPERIANIAKRQTNDEVSHGLIQAKVNLDQLRKPSARLEKDVHYQRFIRDLDNLQKASKLKDNDVELIKQFAFMLAKANDAKNPQKFYRSMFLNQPKQKVFDNISFFNQMERIIAFGKNLFEGNKKLNPNDVYKSLFKFIENIETETPSLAKVFKVFDLDGYFKNATSEISGIPSLLSTDKSSPISRQAFAQVINNVINTSAHLLDIDRVTARNELPATIRVADKIYHYQTIAEQFRFFAQGRTRNSLRESLKISGKELEAKVKQNAVVDLIRFFKDEMSTFRSEPEFDNNRSFLMGRPKLGRIETKNPVDFVSTSGSNNAQSKFRYVTPDSQNFVLTSMIGNWVFSKAMRDNVKNASNVDAIDFFWRKLHISQIVELAAKQGYREVSIPLGEKGIFYQIAGDGKSIKDVENSKLLLNQYKKLVDEIKETNKKIEKNRRDAAKEFVSEADKDAQKVIRDELEQSKKLLMNRKNILEDELGQTGAFFMKDNVIKDIVVKNLEGEPERIKSLESNLKKQLQNQFGEENISVVKFDEVFEKRVETFAGEKVQDKKDKFELLKTQNDEFLKIKIPEGFVNTEVPVDMFSPLKTAVVNLRRTALEDVMVLGTYNKELNKHKGLKNASELFSGELEKKIELLQKDIESVKQPNDLVNPQTVKNNIDRLSAELQQLNLILEDVRLLKQSETARNLETNLDMTAINVQFAGNKQSRVYYNQDISNRSTYISTVPQEFADGVRCLVVEEYFSHNYTTHKNTKKQKAKQVVMRVQELKELLGLKREEAEAVFKTIKNKDARKRVSESFDKAQLKQVERAGGAQKYLEQALREKEKKIAETEQEKTYQS